MVSNGTSNIIGISAQNAPDVLSNYVTVISFLVGTASFVLGIYKGGNIIASPDARIYRTIILALILPSAVLTIYGIIIVIAFNLYGSSLPIFIILLVPIGAVLYLTK